MRYLYVKYALDSEERVVPESHVKDYLEQKVKIGETRLVFWSSDEEETPESLLKKEKFIATVTQKGSYQKGYYEAEILQLAATESELEKLLEKKRLIKKSAKAKEASEASKRGRPRGRKGNNMDNVMKRSEKKNLANLESESSDSRSGEDSEDDVEKTKPYKDEIAKLKNLLEAQSKKLSRYSSILETQNYLEGKMDPLSKNTSNPVPSTSPSTSNNSKEKIELETRMKERPSAPVHDRDEQMLQDDEVCDLENDMLGEHNMQQVQEELFGGNDPNESEHHEEDPEPRQTGGDYKLTKRMLQLIEFDIGTAGEAGDSKFVKSVAVKVFGRSTLGRSSLTGEPPRADQSRTPKTKLDEKRVDYCRSLLLYRINCEKLTFKSKAEYIKFTNDRTRRMKKFRHYLREKLGTEGSAVVTARAKAQRRAAALQDITNSNLKE